MIIGVTASQPLPHRWRGTSPLGGRGGLQSALKFSLSNITARLAGAGQATFRPPTIPRLQASASFIGAGRLTEISTIPYHASAVAFDGSAWLQRHAWLTGVGAYNKAIFSCWTKLSNANDGLWYAAPTGSDFFQQAVTSNAGIKYFNMNITNGYMDTLPNLPAMESAGWQNVLIGVDISTSRIAQIFVNGTDVSTGGTALSGSDNSVSTGTDFYFADDGFGARITGDVADVQMWFNAYLDFSVTANRELFILGGKPVRPTVASATLGTPAILFSGNSSTFPTNQGTGGSFTLHGSLTNAVTSPSD